MPFVQNLAAQNPQSGFGRGNSSSTQTAKGRVERSEARPAQTSPGPALTPAPSRAPLFTTPGQDFSHGRGSSTHTGQGRVHQGSPGPALPAHTPAAPARGPAPSLNPPLGRAAQPVPPSALPTPAPGASMFPAIAGQAARGSHSTTTRQGGSAVAHGREQPAPTAAAPSTAQAHPAPSRTLHGWVEPPEASAPGVAQSNRRQGMQLPTPPRATRTAYAPMGAPMAFAWAPPPRAEPQRTWFGTLFSAGKAILPWIMPGPALEPARGAWPHPEPRMFTPTSHAVPTDDAPPPYSARATGERPRHVPTQGTAPRRPSRMRRAWAFVRSGAVGLVRITLFGVSLVAVAAVLKACLMFVRNQRSNARA